MKNYQLWNEGKWVLLLAALILWHSPSQADFYVEVGLGLTKAELARPEIDLPSPLIKAVAGVTGDYGWRVEFEHISSVQKAEHGAGLNALWVIKKITF